MLRLLNFFELIFLFFFATFLKAESIVISQLSTSDGLAASEITAILQDSDGQIWLGTEVGLNSFDGYDVYQPLPNDKSPKDSPQPFNVEYLYEDKLGTIWIGTYSGGTYQYDKRTNEIRRAHILPQGTNLNGYNLTAVAEDEYGNLWLIFPYEIYRYDRTSSSYQLILEVDDLPKIGSGEAIRAVVHAKEHLLIGTTIGLFAFDIQKNTIRKVPHTPDISSKLFEHNVKTLVINKEGKVLVGAVSGLFQIDLDQIISNSPNVNPIRLASDINVWSLIEEAQYYLLGTDEGVYKLDKENGLTSIVKLSESIYRASSDRITSMIKDREGNIWLGTKRDGAFIVRRNPSVKHHFSTRSSPAKRLVNDFISAVHELPDGSTLLGTEASLERISPETVKDSHVIIYDIHEITGLDRNVSYIAYNNGKVWFPTSDGLRVFDSKSLKEESTNFPASHSDLFNSWGPQVIFLEPNILTIVDGKSIYEYDVLSREIVAVASVPKDKDYFFLEIHARLETEKYAYFLSTTDGLATFNTKSGFVKFLDVEAITKRPENQILDVYNDDERIWITYYGQGISVINYSASREEVFLSEQELNVTGVMNIIPDNNGFLWVSSNSGLIRIDRKNYHSTVYGRDDGFANTEFNGGAAYLLSNGDAFFGSVRGGYIVDLSALSKSKNRQLTPHIHTSSLMSGRALESNTKFQDGQRIRLNHDDFGLKLIFSAFLYNKTEQVKFRYTLSGKQTFDSQSQENNFAFFPKLKPGEYTFSVWATDPLTGIEGPPANLDISVHHAPFSSPLAYTIYLLIFSAFSFYFILMKRRHKEQLTTLLAQKEELLEKKNELFSNVSHEFRTPLTLILGPIKKMLKTKHYQSIHSDLRPILSNANRLLRMVDQLLDLSRFDLVADETGQLINASELVDKTLVSMDSLFEEHQLKLSREIEKVCWISITHDALEKIMVNLFSNAVKYTPRGGCVLIRVSKINDSVTIVVKDNGVGMSPNEKSLIFERFVRLDNKVKEFVPGAGVGLALVKELTERFGGTIYVDSEEGVGSCFTLVFPSEDSAMVSDASSHYTTDTNIIEIEIDGLQVSANEPVETQRETLSDKNTILVVEDNSHMRKFVVGCLEPHYICLSAEDGREGIRKALEEIPDLIITDLMMPNKTGFELASIVRSDHRTSHIPIIMLTAKGDVSSRQKAWKMDIDEYFEKPFDDDELLLRCESLLSIRQLISQRVKREHEQGNIAEQPEIKQSFITENDRHFIERLDLYLESNYCHGSINAERLSNALDMNKKQLQRKVKALLEQSIPEYVSNFRLKKGRELLLQGLSVTDVAMNIGFSSPSYFTKTFTIRYGMSPSEYADVTCKKL